MSPPTIPNHLDQIERRIRVLLSDGAGSAHLCRHANALDIRRPGHTRCRHLILHQFAYRQMLEGMSPDQCTELDKKVRTFIKENPKCTLFPKP